MLNVREKQHKKREVSICGKGKNGKIKMRIKTIFSIIIIIIISGKKINGLLEILI